MKIINQFTYDGQMLGRGGGEGRGSMAPQQIPPMVTSYICNSSLPANEDLTSWLVFLLYVIPVKVSLDKVPEILGIPRRYFNPLVSYTDNSDS